METINKLKADLDKAQQELIALRQACDEAEGWRERAPLQRKFIELARHKGALRAQLRLAQEAQDNAERQAYREAELEGWRDLVASGR